MSCVVDQRVVDRRHRVLPDQLLGRNLRAEVAGARAHVAVRQLEPGAGEGVGELVGILEEAARDLLVGRVEAQRRGRWSASSARCVFDGSCASGTVPAPAPSFGYPLVRAGGALRQLPLEAEQVLEVIVAPLRRRRGPGDLEAAGDGVAALAPAEAALPALALRLETRGLGLGAHMGGRAGAVGLAEGVAACDERHGFATPGD